MRFLNALKRCLPASGVLTSGYVFNKTVYADTKVNTPKLQPYVPIVKEKEEIKVNLPYTQTTNPGCSVEDLYKDDKEYFKRGPRKDPKELPYMTVKEIQADHGERVTFFYVNFFKIAQHFIVCCECFCKYFLEDASMYTL